MQVSLPHWLRLRFRIRTEILFDSCIYNLFYANILYLFSDIREMHCHYATLFMVPNSELFLGYCESRTVRPMNLYRSTIAGYVAKFVLAVWLLSCVAYFFLSYWRFYLFVSFQSRRKQVDCFNKVSLRRNSQISRPVAVRQLTIRFRSAAENWLHGLDSFDTNSSQRRRRQWGWGSFYSYVNGTANTAQSVQ